jgi:hypothetical protein
MNRPRQNNAGPIRPEVPLMAKAVCFGIFQIRKMFFEVAKMISTTHEIFAAVKEVLLATKRKISQLLLPQKHKHLRLK